MYVGRYLHHNFNSLINEMIYLDIPKQLTLNKQVPESASKALLLLSQTYMYVLSECLI